MKSRWIVPLFLSMLVPCLPAAAQVVPLSQVNPNHSSVQPAGCHSCGTAAAVPMMDSGTVWGTSCLDCGYKPTLFPPCPNPCDRTLLGELLYGVRDAVDCGLSRVSCCLFGGCGMPCGCETVCGCEAPACSSGCGCDASVDAGYSTMEPVMASPTPAVPQPAPAPAEPQANPFQDDPAQGAGVQPIKKASQAIPAPRRSQPVRRAARVQRTSFEETANTVSPSVYVEEVTAQPLPKVSTGRDSYSLRRTTSQRTSRGVELRMAPIQETGSPAVRFRGE